MSKNKNQSKRFKAEEGLVQALLERLVAINLYAHGASKQEIAKNLHLRRTKVDSYLKGMKVTSQK
jgi:predicted transcriptional regulator